MTISSDTGLFLQQYFDQILVVTVPRFAERQAQVKERLAGLPFAFFQGADKLQLDMDQLKNNGEYDEKQAAAKQRRGMALNSGEVACALSHRKVYEKMIREGWKKILILEDDVVPAYEELALLPETLRELPEDWELVYLGYLKHEKVTAGLKMKQFFYSIGAAIGLMKWSLKMVGNLLPRPFSKHLRRAGFHDCTHAYAITLAAAEKLMNAQTPVVYRADDLLSALTMKGELKAFVTDPKFFGQEVFHDPTGVSEIR